MSFFYGIVITMFFDEARHLGRPHFHAEYAGAKATYDIRTFNWRLMRDRQSPRPIDPLR